MDQNLKKKIFFGVVLLVIVIAAFLFVSLLREDENTVSEVSNTQIEFTDISGNIISFDEPPKSIILCDNYLELFIVGGKNVVDKLVGWTAKTWVSWRNDIFETFAEEVPKLRDLPDVGLTAFGGKFDVEKVMSLKPDVIIFPRYQYMALEQGAKQMLEDSGIKIVEIDFSTGTVANHLKSLEIMGILFDQRARAKEVSDLYLYYLDKINEKIKDLKEDNKKAVYLEKAAKGPQIFDETWGGSNWAPIIERAGGFNISKKLFKELGYADNEFILTEDPDFIILAGSTWPKKKDAVQMGFSISPTKSRTSAQKYVDERAGWKNLKAVKNEQFLLVHHGFIRSILDFIPTIYFAEKFYPKKFTDISAKKVATEFFKKYLPVEFKGSWLESLYVK